MGIDVTGSTVGNVEGSRCRMRRKHVKHGAAIVEFKSNVKCGRLTLHPGSTCVLLDPRRQPLVIFPGLVLSDRALSCPLQKTVCAYLKSTVQNVIYNSHFNFVFRVTDRPHDLGLTYHIQGTTPNPWDAL